MADAIKGYPRWDGELRTGSKIPVIMDHEFRRAWASPWFQAVLVVLAGFTVLMIAAVWQSSQTQGESVHNMRNFLSLLNAPPITDIASAIMALILRRPILILALAATAIAAGNAFTEDRRHGALELYMSRALSLREYLLGKALPVALISVLAVWIPTLLYWGASWVLFEEHPDVWTTVPLRALAFALMFGVMVSGLGLGLSLVARSDRAAALILFGGVAVTDIIVTRLFEAVSNNDVAQLMSPLSALQQQFVWLFDVEAPYTFPYWWGLLVIAAWTLIGWGLVVWKRPRVTESADADAPAGGEVRA